MARGTLEYQSGHAPPGPFSRRALAAAFFCLVSILLVVVLWGCYFEWLVRPSTVGKVLDFYGLSMLATLVCGVRFRRLAIPMRGQWLAVVAVTLSLCSCIGTLPLMGPAAETIEFHFRYANRGHFQKIAAACRSYVATHGVYPPHLAVLVANSSITVEDLLDPFSHTTAAMLPPGLKPADWPSIVSLIEAHCDYVYTGASVPDVADESLILLYDKAIPERPGRLIQDLFGSNFVPMSDLSKVFDNDAALRRAGHLATIPRP